MKYNPKVVASYFESQGLGIPTFEWGFHPERKWRFDMAWPDSRIALEVQGGIWIAGGHNRGAGLRREHEKRNAAAALGWRILYVEPCELCTMQTCALLRQSFSAGIEPEENSGSAH